ncbi:MAG: zf-HC2 domain-containing protein [Acidobacteriota bacterium]|nr:zf-HC2 domain-containing protein [Acidobacteriota bacterium]
MNRMCIDQGQFEPDEYWRSLGVVTAEQVRQELLWRAAESGIPSEHAARCPGCASLLESLTRLRAILLPADEGQVAVARCPDAHAIAGYQSGELAGKSAQLVREHLKECSPCREDLAFLARSQEPRERALPMRRRVLLMAVAAAALLATVIPWKRGPDTAKPEKLDFTPSSRYASLAQMPPLDRAELLRESPRSHHPQLERVLDAYEKGEFSKAGEYAGVMANVVEDPSAEYMLAMALYRQNKMPQAYQAIKVAERIKPETAYRCYTTLQFALLMGDRNTVIREAGHASAEPEYAPRCRDVLTRI